MIDIHCHILYGIDDGAETKEDTIAMLKEAIAEGIHTIVATPHHDRHFTNHREDILTFVTQVNEWIQDENLPIKLLPGQEIRIFSDLIQEIEKEDTSDLLTYVNQSKYALIEFPHHDVPDYAESILYELKIRGITPVIAHPERNKKLIENPDLLYQFVQNGALSQVTTMSVMGGFGRKIQKFSLDLYKHHLAHFLASDAHNLTTRSFKMQEAIAYIEKQCGNEMMAEIYENTERLVAGEAIVPRQCQRIKRKKLLGIF
ncbi:MAG TPA: CpsB/CapC family capsule biosynthesis tyrosine phosphatase [Massilibacterium sp.]|nr:CpsB/CapC family capsule biosynthesis tyrosine phosphatase [Massilibacterium sp.]